MAMAMRRFVPAGYRTIFLNEDHMYRGSLILVNAAHPVKSFEPRLASVSGRLLTAGGGEEPDIALDEVTLRQLTALLDACDGKERITVVSGYRSKDVQRSIYLNTLRERGAAYTRSYVALPGASEHQTGLAVDVGIASSGLDYIAPTFEGTIEADRFKRMAAKYGFIQRYQSSKSSITGIANEPWHYRYVGFPHASIMERERLCLEEYTELLRAYRYGDRHWKVEDENQRYEMYYVEGASRLTAVPVPVEATADWHVSGNNVDGFVITASYRKGPERYGC